MMTEVPPHAPAPAKKFSNNFNAISTVHGIVFESQLANPANSCATAR
ncbi:hypothetical protein ACVWYQ_004491 [Bradyrhizobium sp. USDA 3397]